MKLTKQTEKEGMLGFGMALAFHRKVEYNLTIKELILEKYGEPLAARYFPR